jgi:hypothetical protein
MGNSFSNSEVNDSDDNSVLAELGLLFVTLEMVSSHLEEQENLLQSLLHKVGKDENKERHRQSQKKDTPQPSQRTFHEITQRMLEKTFQRTFRMQQKSFYKLSALIAKSVGEDKFRSETCTRAEKYTHEATEFRGGEISGELRLGLLLRLMTGSSYLDLLMIYGVSQGAVYQSFQTVTGWVINRIPVIAPILGQRKWGPFFAVVYLPQKLVLLPPIEGQYKPFQKHVSSYQVNRTPAIRNLALRVTPIFSNKTHALNT